MKTQNKENIAGVLLVIAFILSFISIIISFSSSLSENLFFPWGVPLSLFALFFCFISGSISSDDDYHLSIIFSICNIILAVWSIALSCQINLHLGYLISWWVLALFFVLTEIFFFVDKTKVKDLLDTACRKFVAGFYSVISIFGGFILWRVLINLKDYAQDIFRYIGYTLAGISAVVLIIFIIIGYLKLNLRLKKGKWK